MSTHSWIVYCVLKKIETFTKNKKYNIFPIKNNNYFDDVSFVDLFAID
jgi:hypothetical protein